MRVLHSIALGLAVTSLGCGYAHVNRDRTDRPETTMGTGATILMPGQPAPSMSSRVPAGSGGSSSAQSSGGSQSGSSTTGGTPGAERDLTMIGGASGERDVAVRERDAPLGPLAVLLGYPFWIFGKSVQEEADESQAADRRAAGPLELEHEAPPRSPEDAAQRARMEAENARLLEGLQAAAGSGAQAAPGGSIRAELAALERTLGGGTSSAAARRETRQAVDRNADGRPDVWEYRAEGEGSREVLDDDHDGRADRILHYDAERRLVRSEEDTTGDGLMDSLSVYSGGEISRKRQDTDADGQVDSWTLYRGGQMVRHEIDRDGDGFRDLVMVYADGQLVREEEDRNADGRPDRLTHFRDGERVEEHVDVDHDGRPDVASFYRNGKLVRREASSEGVLRDWTEGPTS